MKNAGQLIGVVAGVVFHSFKDFKKGVEDGFSEENAPIVAQLPCACGAFVVVRRLHQGQGHNIYDATCPDCGAGPEWDDAE